VCGIGLKLNFRKINLQAVPSSLFLDGARGGGVVSNKHEKEVKGRCRTESGGREASHFGSEDGVERAALRSPA
jgi:hypothetical protein